MFQRSQLLAIAVALLTAPACFAQSGFDTIKVVEGAPLRGTITSMSQNDVSYEATGVTKKVTVPEIVEIIYASEPTDLRNARSLIQSGRFEDAKERLDKLDATGVARDAILQEIEFYKAVAAAKLAMAGAGDKTEAARAVGAFRAKYAGNYHYYEATQLMGDLASAMGRNDVAADQYKLIGAAPWPDYKMKAAVLEGQAQQRAGDFTAAQANFDKVLGAQLNTPAARREKDFAALGKAVCLSAAGSPQEGIKLVESVIARNNSKDVPLFAKAYNAKGACNLKAGKNKEALLDYLHTDLLFFADAEAHAEALFHLTKLWTEDRKGDRAALARQTLASQYPGSVWAARQNQN